MNYHFNAPSIIIKITTVDGEKFQIEGGNLSNDILYLNTTKKLHDSYGTFSLTLVCRDSYKNFFNKMSFDLTEKASPYEVFRPMSLIDIFINDQEIMLGIIDRVKRRVDIKSGTGSKSINISGRDMGAFLTDHKIWYDGRIAGEKSFYNYSYFAAVASLGAVKGTPAEIIEKMMNNWFVKVINQPIPPKDVPDFIDSTFAFSDGESVQDKLIMLKESTGSYSIKADYDIVHDGETIQKKGSIIATATGPGCLAEISYGNYYPISWEAWGQQGSLIDSIRSFISYPLNEVFVETGGCQVVLGNYRKFNGEYYSPSATMKKEYVLSNTGQAIATEVPFFGVGMRVKDLLKSKAYLVYRPTPFDDLDVEGGIEGKDTIDSLLTMQDLIEYYIDDSVIITKDLEMSRSGKGSFYSVTPNNGKNFSLQKIVKPEYDNEALGRYGYIPIEAHLNYFSLFSSKFTRGTPQSVCQAFQKKLKSWYTNSDKYLNGRFVIMGSPRIRIGNRLMYVRVGGSITGSIENEYEEGSYYITGVEHNYSFTGKFFETSIDVERGVNRKLIKTKKIAIEL